MTRRVKRVVSALEGHLTDANSTLTEPINSSGVRINEGNLFICGDCTTSLARSAIIKISSTEATYLRGFSSTREKLWRAKCLKEVLFKFLQTSDPPWSPGEKSQE